MNGALVHSRSVYWSRSSSETSSATHSGTRMTTIMRTPPGASIHSGRWRRLTVRRLRTGGRSVAVRGTVVTAIYLLCLVKGVLRSLLRVGHQRPELGVVDLAGLQAGDRLDHDVEQGQLDLAPRAAERRAVRLRRGVDDRGQCRV